MNELVTLLSRHEEGLSFTALRAETGLERHELRERLERGLKAGKLRRTGAGQEIRYHANVPNL